MESCSTGLPKGVSRKHSAQLADRGSKADLKNLKGAYFRTPTMSKKKYESMVSLLEIFAQHLSLVANQLLIQQGNSENPAITHAQQFIAEHQAEELSLGRVAHAANMSSYYFCKMFRKATGVNFTHYLSHVRVEKAKSLLLNPNARVSEVAFDTGFTSITNFNRTFKQLVGSPPRRTDSHCQKPPERIALAPGRILTDANWLKFPPTTPFLSHKECRNATTG